MNTQQQFNIEFKIKSLELDFGFDRDIEAVIEKYARLAKVVKIGSLDEWEENRERLLWATGDVLNFLLDRPVSYNFAPGYSEYWKTLSNLLHEAFRESESDAAWLVYDNEATSCSKAGDKANERAEKAENFLYNGSSRRRSSTLAKLEDEVQEANELAADMWEESTKWRDQAEELTEAAADMDNLVAMVDEMATLMVEWDHLMEAEAAAVLADIMAEKEADEPATMEAIEVSVDNTPAEVEKPVATKETPKPWPDGLTASGSSNEYIFGRVGRSAWVNFARVSPYMDNQAFAPLWLQYHGPEKNIIKYICDELGVVAHRGRSCRWNGDHTIHDQRFFLADGLTEDGCPNIVAVLVLTTARREVATDLLVKWWWNRSDLNPRNTYYRQPAALPAPAKVEAGAVEPTKDAEVETVATKPADLLTAGIESGRVLLCSVPKAEDEQPAAPLQSKILTNQNPMTMKKGVKKHWRESITVEIEWPWITPHCTLAYSKRQITLYTDGVWLEGDRWVCEFSWPCENDRILISGYFDIYAVGGDCTTQHVRAARTFDGLRETEEKYKIRVLAAA